MPHDWPSRRGQGLVLSIVPDEEHEAKEGRSQYNARCLSKRSLWLVTLCMGILLLIVGFLYSYWSPPTSFKTYGQCQNMAIRREWRSLTNAEKQEYIRAVQCLKTSPSRLGLNQSLYDDFPYVHSRNGKGCECPLSQRL